MYIWLLISKAERQVAGARSQANEHKISRTSVRKAGGTPPSRKAGEGGLHCRGSETMQSPLPCFPAGILERYRSHRTNYITDINKLLIEYQWNINRISTISRISSKWEAPRGGPDGSEGAGRVQSGQTLCGWSLCALPAPSRGGPGGLPRRAPVQGSGERQ